MTERFVIQSFIHFSPLQSRHKRSPSLSMRGCSHSLQKSPCFAQGSSICPSGISFILGSPVCRCRRLSRVCGRVSCFCRIRCSILRAWFDVSRLCCVGRVSYCNRLLHSSAFYSCLVELTKICLERITTIVLCFLTYTYGLLGTHNYAFLTQVRRSWYIFTV